VCEEREIPTPFAQWPPPPAPPWAPGEPEFKTPATFLVGIDPRNRGKPAGPGMGCWGPPQDPRGKPQPVFEAPGLEDGPGRGAGGPNLGESFFPLLKKNTKPAPAPRLFTPTLVDFTGKTSIGPRNHRPPFYGQKFPRSKENDRRNRPGWAEGGGFGGRAPPAPPPTQSTAQLKSNRAPPPPPGWDPRKICFW